LIARLILRLLLNENDFVRTKERGRGGTWAEPACATSRSFGNLSLFRFFFVSIFVFSSRASGLSLSLSLKVHMCICLLARARVREKQTKVFFGSEGFKVLRKVFVWRCKLSAPIKKDIRVIRISTREVSVSEGGRLEKEF
jgi:hypothetical protein